MGRLNIFLNRKSSINWRLLVRHLPLVKWLQCTYFQVLWSAFCIYHLTKTLIFTASNPKKRPWARGSLMNVRHLQKTATQLWGSTQLKYAKVTWGTGPKIALLLYIWKQRGQKICRGLRSLRELKEGSCQKNVPSGLVAKELINPEMSNVSFGYVNVYVMYISTLMYFRSIFHSHKIILYGSMFIFGG